MMRWCVKMFGEDIKTVSVENSTKWKVATMTMKTSIGLLVSRYIFLLVCVPTAKLKDQ